jgi:hypothetical protein
LSRCHSPSCIAWCTIASSAAIAAYAPVQRVSIAEPSASKRKPIDVS